MRPARFDPQPRKWPKQPRSRATFDALLDATARVLEEEGYAALTTNRVAERAGASIGSLYEYFPDGDTMVALLVAREVRSVLDALEKSMEARHDEPFAPAMRAWLGDVYAALHARRRLVREIVTSVPFAGRLPVVDELAVRLVAIAASGGSRRSEEVDLDEVPHAIFLVAHMTQGAFAAMLLAAPRRVAREAMLDDLTELVLRMLRPRAVPAATTMR